MPARYLVLVLLCVGCAGGQSTDDTAECPAEGLLELKTDSTSSEELGLAPQEVLDWALAKHSLLAEWRPIPEGLESAVEVGEVELEFEFERGRGPAIDNVCEERIDIPVQASVRSGDGVLDADLQGTLSASSEGYATANLMLGTEDLPWSVTSSKSRIHRADVVLRLIPEGSAGSLELGIETEHGSSVSDRVRRVLSWPVGQQCADYGVPFEPDDGIGSDWTAPIARANSGTWMDRDSQQTLELTLEDRGHLCQSEYKERGLPVVLRVAASDSVDFKLQGEFRRAPDSDSLEFEITDDNYAEHTDEFVRTHGDFGVDLSRYDYLSFEITLQLTELTGAGRFRVIGDLAEDGSDCDSCSSREETAWEMSVELAVE